MINLSHSRNPAVRLCAGCFLVVLVLGVLLATSGPAQTFTTLHSFTAVGSYPYTTNSDGAYPYAGLILSDSTLYGTAALGGSSGDGIVFKINSDGTGFTDLHSFTGSDGVSLQARLILSDGTLYGTAALGGSSGSGTVFAVNTDGAGFTNLHSFTALAPYNPPYPQTNSDGNYPSGGLILSGTTLYGTTYEAGSYGAGTVFAVNTDGTRFTNLYSFAATHTNSSGLFTNSDGAYPYAGLILSGTTLYGTTYEAGSYGAGTVFAVNTDGTGFTNLHSFTALSPYDPSNPQTNSDGAYPLAGLTLSGSTLYGTTQYGGSSGNGTVFAVNTDGAGFTNLYNFTALSSYYTGTNRDGANPYAGLILSGNRLYGTAGKGGTWGYGTVFTIKTDGTGFSTLYSFRRSDGVLPTGGLILSGNSLYGTTEFGGSGYSGTVFKISFRPQLTITPEGPNVILSWPTNYTGFDYTGFTLESTTNLLSPAAWVTNSPAPVVIGGQNTVTNPITGAQMFYRLIK